MSPIPEVSPDDPPALFAGAFSRLRKLPQPRQIVGGGGEGEGPSDALVGAELGSLLAGDHLDPAEGFLDPLADALAQSVAGMARPTVVDRRRAAVRILRNVRRRVHRAQFTDEVLGVVSLGGTERNRPRSGWRQDRSRCPGGLPRRRIRNRLERLQLMRGRQRGRGRRTPHRRLGAGGSINRSKIGRGSSIPGPRASAAASNALTAHDEAMVRHDAPRGERTSPPAARRLHPRRQPSLRPPPKGPKPKKTSIVRSAQMKFFGVVRNFGQDEILMI